mgnify:CR=1 FL=1
MIAELTNQIIHIIVTESIFCDHILLNLAKSLSVCPVVGGLNGSKITVVISSVHSVTPFESERAARQCRAARKTVK